MGRRSQQKGKRGEYDSVHAMQSMGIPAVKTSNLQAGKGRDKHTADIAWGPGYVFTAENKREADSWRGVYKALGAADWLIVDGYDVRLYVIPESTVHIVFPVRWKGDPMLGDIRYESAARTFARLRKDLASADMLIVKADNRERLFVIPESTARIVFPDEVAKWEK